MRALLQQRRAYEQAQRDKRKNLFNSAVYVFLVLMAGVIENKENYHVDEIYSYGLANNTTGDQITFEDGIKYGRKELSHIDYMSVSESERFNYANVWENQANDVHPPLYYALLHTLCSIFPGSIRIWYAGTINIVFALLTLYILRKLLRLLWEKDYLVSDI